MLPEGFVYLDEAVPSSLSDAKYATSDNFTGRPVDGYSAARVVGTRELADALVKAAQKAREQGLRLLFWDAYRPQRAVRDFITWSNQPEDFKTKARHYPNIERTDLIPLGYVAEYSGHSRGSSIDLTLTDLNGEPLDMGGCFDLMDEHSHHGAPGCTSAQTAHRETLKALMVECGFKPYQGEWWHYTLLNEPYPGTYFDFPIE